MYRHAASTALMSMLSYLRPIQRQLTLCLRLRTHPQLLVPPLTVLATYHCRGVQLRLLSPQNERLKSDMWRPPNTKVPEQFTRWSSWRYVIYFFGTFVTVDALKRAKRGTHRNVWNPKWRTPARAPWLVCDAQGMWCKCCRSTKTKGANGATVWSETPCQSYRNEAIVKHETSSQHKKAIEIFARRAGAAPSAKTALAEARGAETEAMMKIFSMIHWLCKEEIAVHKYQSLRQLCTFLGVSGLDAFAHRNARYTSSTFTTEAISSIASVFSDNLKKALQRSPAVGLMLDESDDVSHTSQCIIFCQYVNRDGSVGVGFIGITRPILRDGATLFGVLKEVAGNMGIPLRKVYALGTDGCGAMMGKKVGVATRLRQACPASVAVHCVARRLALAPKDAAECVSVLATVISTGNRPLIPVCVAGVVYSP